MLRLGRKLSRAIHKGITNQDAVEVSEMDGVRSLYLGSDTVQSAMRVKAPYDLELAYSRGMMMFLMFAYRHENILLLGLGGGSIPKFLYHYVPEARTTVVEINPEIIRVSRSHFYMPENDANLQVIEADGVIYLQEHPNSADVLMLDIFDSQGIPPDMYSQDFFDSCSEALKIDGMLAVNLWGSDRNFDLYLQRLQQSFHDRVLILPTGRPGNIVVFGFKRAPRDLRWSSLRDRAKQLESKYKIEFLEYVEKLREHNPASSNRLLLDAE